MKAEIYYSLLIVCKLSNEHCSEKVFQNIANRELCSWILKALMMCSQTDCDIDTHCYDPFSTGPK